MLDGNWTTESEFCSLPANVDAEQARLCALLADIYKSRQRHSLIEIIAYMAPSISDGNRDLVEFDASQLLFNGARNPFTDESYENV